MKILAAIFAALLLLSSCKDDEHHIVYSVDLFFFASASPSEGWNDAVTQITANAQSQVDLLVMRNAFSAQEYPKQTAKIIVEEGPERAKLGTDFSLNTQTFNFPEKSTTSLPLQVQILGSASGKKIVLKLDYPYYDVCPEVTRTNTLTIDVK